MEKIIDEKFVVDSIKKHLESKWKVIKEADLHQRGCDLILEDKNNRGRKYFIECKKKSYAKHARAVNETVWLYALGQLVTRMSVVARHAYLYGLGLPEVSAKKALKRIPRQAAKILCLHIFSVDDKGNVKKYSPKDFKN